MTTYGYRIMDGEAVIDEAEAEKLVMLFMWYLTGKSIKECALMADIPSSIAGRALSNSAYLGTDFYPAIIDAETFEKAQVERKKRNHHRPETDKARIASFPVSHMFRINKRVYTEKPQTDDLVGWLYENIDAGEDEQSYKTQLDKNEQRKLREFIFCS